MLPERIQQVRRSAVGARITRYTIGSLVAFVTSAVVFPVMLITTGSTTWSSVTAFVAGAIPNWVLNRRWAWKIRGKVNFWREIFAYVVISLIQLAATSWTTGWTHRHIATSAPHGLRALIVDAAYCLVFVIMFAGKFAVYEFWIFSDRRGLRAAVRSRHQVWTAARANRTP
ncbi:MAG TPA: GtrA family protein [Solirubrobacteraceae bacterium]|nr:GtrA family protein [Solirubrobacteraceae bacterium]